LVNPRSCERREAKKIDYGMAVVRHVGPPINLLDVAITHTRMAT
jgi:hypothetical protein